DPGTAPGPRGTIRSRPWFSVSCVLQTRRCYTGTDEPTEVQSMKTPIAVVRLAVVLGAGPATAQNLVIANGRILDGTGKIIERGTVVVRDGKIVSVAAGTPAAVPGARVIDARGMTVMPGFIDAHRHPVPGN